MRLIALDLGTKKCGVAITDPLQIIAQPLETIYYEHQDFDFLLNRLQQIINTYKPIEKIVIGLPLNVDKSLTPMAKIVLKFEKQLKSFINIDTVFQDEKYTSKESDQVMQQMNLSHKQKKAKRDQIAAVKILENYMLKNNL